MQTNEEDVQVPMFGAGSPYSKMFPDFSPPTAEKTSVPSWRKLCGSRNQTLLFLDMRGGGGQTQDLLSATDFLSRGELSTLNTGERPSVGVASLWSPTSMAYSRRRSCLSAILEEDPDPKYTLSPKACRGILSRAERRGKELPEILREALEKQAATCVPETTSADIGATE